MQLPPGFPGAPTQPQQPQAPQGYGAPPPGYPQQPQAPQGYPQQPQGGFQPSGQWGAPTQPQQPQAPQGYGPPPGYPQPQAPQGYGAPPGYPQPQAPQGYGAPPPGYPQQPQAPQGYPQQPQAPQGYGAPPPGYGPPPGYPQQQGYPQQGQPYEGPDPFSKVGTMDLAGNLPYVEAGQHRFAIGPIKLTSGPKGMFYVVELICLQTSNPNMEIGGHYCFMPRVDGQYGDSGVKDAQALASAALGIAPADPRSKVLGFNSPAEAHQFMVESRRPSQPLRGRVVEATSFDKPKKTKPEESFTKHSWRPVLDAQGQPMTVDIDKIPAPVMRQAAAPQAAPPGYATPPAQTRAYSQAPETFAQPQTSYGVPLGQGYTQPQRPADPAPVQFGYPQQPAPAQAPQEEWHEFQPPDPRAGFMVWNNTGTIRAK